MVAFRQVIRPGDVGRDVLAVKRAMRRMGVKGSGALNRSKRSGPAFVRCLHVVMRNHGVHVDNIYGPKVHEIIAPHFDAYGRVLYKTAAIRKPKPPPYPGGTAKSNAQKLLRFHSEGKYHADNPGDLRDIQATAEGRAVWSQGGYYVHIDARVMQVLVWLIESGFRIGTYAICSDHHNDGPHGHSGGRAVDISSVNGISVGSHSGRAATLACAQAIHSKRPSALAARQLICDGYGYMHDYEISKLCIPNAAFYGFPTLAQHRNHIHLGF